MPKSFKLNGKPLDLNPLPPLGLKVIAYLDKAPSDEVFTIAELARRLGIVSQSSWALVCTREELQPYITMLKRGRVLGNPAAITELKRRVSGQTR